MSTDTPTPEPTDPATESEPTATSNPTPAGQRDAADAPLGEPGLRALQQEREARERLEREMKGTRDALLKAFGVDKDESGDDIVKTLQQQVSAMQRDNLVNTVARRHGITDDEDIELLRVTPDETAMARLAQRLKAANSTPTPPTLEPDPGQGSRPTSPEAAQDAEYAAFFPPSS